MVEGKKTNLHVIFDRGNDWIGFPPIMNIDKSSRCASFAQNLETNCDIQNTARVLYV